MSGENDNNFNPETLDLPEGDLEGQEGLESSDEGSLELADGVTDQDVSEAIDKAEQIAKDAAQSGDKDTAEKAKATLKRLYKIKVDGREIEEEIDLGDDEYIKKQLQLAKVSQKRMQEKAEIEKQQQRYVDSVSKWFQLLSEDPMAALSDPAVKELGIDPKMVADMILEKELQEAAKTPEQKEQERLRAELEEKTRKLEEIQRAKEHAEMEAMRNRIAGQIEQEITSAMDEGGLPQSEFVVAKMAQMIETATRLGIKVTAKEIAPIVKADYDNYIKNQVTKLSDEELFKLVGEERFERARKARIAKAKAAPTPKASPKAPDVAQAPKKEGQEKIPMKDFFNSLGTGYFG
jgi:hypothetical protein